MENMLLNPALYQNPQDSSERAGPTIAEELEKVGLYKRASGVSTLWGG